MFRLIHSRCHTHTVGIKLCCSILFLSSSLSVIFSSPQSPSTSIHLRVKTQAPNQPNPQNPPTQRNHVLHTRPTLHGPRTPPGRLDLRTCLPTRTPPPLHPTSQLPTLSSHFAHNQHCQSSLFLQPAQLGRQIHHYPLIQDLRINSTGILFSPLDFAVPGLCISVDEIQARDVFFAADECVSL